MNLATDHAMAGHLYRKLSLDATQLLLWVVALAFLIQAGVAIFVDITTSGWEIGLSITHWLLLGYGAWAAYRIVPLYVAHGLTRREFLRHLPGWVLVTAALAAVVTAGAYVVERGIYQLMDWPHEVAPSVLWSSPTQFHLVALEHLFLHSTWLIVGVFLGAAFYRDGLLGTVCLAPAFVILAVEGGTFGSERGAQPFGFLMHVVDPDLPPPLHILVWAAALGIGFAISYAVIRDLPVRTRSS
jgi:hypothetical protein